MANQKLMYMGGAALGLIVLAGLLAILYWKQPQAIASEAVGRDVPIKRECPGPMVVRGPATTNRTICFTVQNDSATCNMVVACTNATLEPALLPGQGREFECDLAPGERIEVRCGPVAGAGCCQGTYRTVDCNGRI